LSYITSLLLTHITAYVSINRNIFIMRERNLKELSVILAGMDDASQLEKLLEEMLTPSEIDALVLRWELLKMLNDGIPQREISKALGVSLCKITRGSRELKKEDSVVKGILKRLDEKKSGEKISRRIQ
jgi:TrpR family transcriptional regulator, trp operon repressor